MAKSIIEKELNNNLDFDIEKIRRFTQDELAKLADSTLPFCYQLGADTVVVGHSKIVKINNNCWKVTNPKVDPKEFCLRKSAIFYCIALHTNRFIDAAEIYSADSLLNTLEFDAILYRQRYKSAMQRNDTWNIVLFSDRYTETMLRIAQTKKRLKEKFDK